MRYHIASASLAAVLAMGFGSGAAQAEIDGSDIYDVRCATCHGANGEGTKGRIPALGPPLKGNDFVVNAPESVLRDVIRNGRQGADRTYDDEYPNMPAFDYTMVDDIEALIEFLQGDMQE